MLKREDILIRDPFILTDKENGCYYMYGTTALEKNSIFGGCIFEVFRSRDLENFEEPKVIFDGRDAAFFTLVDYWAPEVHFYNGKYYLFGTYGYRDKKMAVVILVSDTPDGVFVPLTGKPISHPDYMCLDGTFFVEDGVPYLFYTAFDEHGNGIYRVQLSDDLSESVGTHEFLFAKEDYDRAFAVKTDAKKQVVAEGAFLYRRGDGVRMLWSGYDPSDRYTLYTAVAKKANGSFTLEKEPLFQKDGGHAMSFVSLEGQRYIALHSPNTPGQERLHLIPVEL